MRALDAVDVAFAAGRFTAVMGSSGSGKFTLLHSMAALDALTSGETWIGDTDISTLSGRERTRPRRDRIGFVFHAFNLVPTLTARENIALPARLAGRPNRLGCGTGGGVGGDGVEGGAGGAGAAWATAPALRSRGA